MISEALQHEMALRVADRYSAIRIAARYEIRQAARLACHSGPTRTASSVLTEKMLIAMAEGALIPREGMPRRAAFTGLLRQFQQISSAVQRFPKMWDKLKDVIGVDRITELPGKLKELASEGHQLLKKIIGKVFQWWPLKLYLLPESKIVGLNTLIEKLLNMSPAFSRFLKEKVKPKIDQFDAWLREHLPKISRLAMVAIYIWIWLNVVEFEWDLKGLIDAATGHLTLADLLASLPSSILGFMMNSLGFGTFTLLPHAYAVRLLVVIGARYIEWKGGSFHINTKALQEDFGISPDLLPSAV